jgi:hypothetical protein
MTAASCMPEMRTLGTVILVTAPMVLLAASLCYSYGLWTSPEEADMPLGHYIAMAGGILFSLPVGIGLMALAFYSCRHGYDDRAAGREIAD